MFHSIDSINSNLSVDYMFYIYDVSPYSFDDLEYIVGWGSDGKESPKSDFLLYNILKKSVYRTIDPENAKLFIIPIDFEKLYFKYKDNMNEYYKILKEILNKISCNKYFNNGKNHMLFTFLFNFSRWCDHSEIILPDSIISKFENCISTRYEIWNQSKFQRVQFPHLNCDGWTWQNQLWEITKQNIIIPCETWIDDSKNLKIYNYYEWIKRKHLIFLHTRENRRYSSQMASDLRSLPIDNLIFKNKGSIGFPLPYDEWLRDITNSKFCFVMRGDTPTSHTFNNAIAVGSIPVVISNHFDLVGLPFIDKNIFNESIIRIEENYFLQNPEKVLYMLENIEKEQIDRLMYNLNILQTIFLYNHPNNLIDKALLKNIEPLL